MKLLVVIILLSIFSQSHCLFTFYQPGLLNSTYYKCIKPTVNGRIILVFLYYEDKIFPGCQENIQSAIDAGLAVEIALAPTRCWPIDEELRFLVKSFEGKKIDRFWLALEEVRETDCLWGNFSPEENCQYLQEYISKAGKMGMKIEIVGLTFEWIDAFKDQQGCPEISNTSLLWWFHDTK